MLDLTHLKEIARNRIKNAIKTEADLMEFLKVWWSDKYNLPDNHPLFLSKTLEELVIDYFTDKFMSDPDSLKETSAKEAKEAEEQLKKDMGEDYHEEYDYLIPPTETELNNKPSEEEPEDEIEEDFTAVRHINDE